MEPILGIDISKAKFDVVLRKNNGKYRHKVYKNNQNGFRFLSKWLQESNISKVRICLEATGIYGEALSEYLHTKGHVVYVVNPAKIHAFAKSKLSRNKTDKADAKIIAQYCAQEPNLRVWHPKPAHVKQLGALTKRLDTLKHLKQAEENHLESATDKLVRKSIKKVISHLVKQIEQMKKQINDQIDAHPDLKEKQGLLDSIPGLGETTIPKVLSFLGNPEDFASAKQMAAFVGTTPQHRESGSSVRGTAHISRIGDAKLRTAFYFPAMTAMRCNPILKDFFNRLEENGKAKKVIICAIMRKLIHIIYGVLKSGKKFSVASV